PPTCCDPLCRRAVRVSMGTVFQMPWTYIGDAPSQWPHPGLDRLKAMGFATAAMALTDDSVSLRDPALAAEEKLAIVLGTEGDGLAPRSEEHTSELQSRFDPVCRLLPVQQPMCN